MASSSPPVFTPPVAKGRWASALSGEEGAAQALNDLAGAYWYPAYAYLRSRGADSETAAAQVESLLTRLLCEPLRMGDTEPPGTFREMLLTLAREMAEEPNPRAATLEIDRVWAEKGFAREPSKSPEQIFARRWTLTVLEFTLSMLEAEYAAAGRAAAFAELRSFLGYSGGGEEAYGQAADRLGISQSAARTGVFEMRKRYREILHAQIADTVARADLVEGEHMTLLAAL